MKRILLICLLGTSVITAYAAQSEPTNVVQPFSAVVWTTTTLHSPSGKSFLFTRRTLYTRDAKGNVRREIYRPSKGLQHDTATPLERVVTGTTSAQESLPVISGREKVQRDERLGTLKFQGLPAEGRRLTLQDNAGQHSRTLETWFNPALGLTVHEESHNDRGDTVVSDLSELNLSDPVASSTQAASVPSAPLSLLRLYRALFSHVAHMERDRQANDPDAHVNMQDIEDHLRKKLGFSGQEWQALVDTSVGVDNYTREKAGEARSLAERDRAARRDNSSAINASTVGRVALHAMQMELNTHVQEEVDKLQARLGPDATGKMQAYLQGPLTESITVVPVKSLRSTAQKGQAQ